MLEQGQVDDFGDGDADEEVGRLRVGEGEGDVLPGRGGVAVDGLGVGDVGFVARRLGGFPFGGD